MSGETKATRRKWTILNGETVGPTLIGPAIAYAENVKVREVGAGLIPAEDVAVLIEALENLKNLVDDDHQITISEADEKEYWVNDHSVQNICEDALAEFHAKHPIETKERG